MRTRSRLERRCLDSGMSRVDQSLRTDLTRTGQTACSWKKDDGAIKVKRDEAGAFVPAFFRSQNTGHDILTRKPNPMDDKYQISKSRKPQTKIEILQDQIEELVKRRDAEKSLAAKQAI